MWQQATAGYDIITESIFIVFDDDFVNSVREGNKRPAHWQNQEEICVYFHLVELKFLFLLKQGISVAASVVQYKCSPGGMFCNVICSFFFCESLQVRQNVLLLIDRIICNKELDS